MERPIGTRVSLFPNSSSSHIDYNFCGGVDDTAPRKRSKSPLLHLAHQQVIELPRSSALCDFYVKRFSIFAKTKIDYRKPVQLCHVYFIGQLKLWCTDESAARP